MGKKQSLQIPKFPLLNRRIFTRDKRIITHIEPTSVMAVADEETGQAIGLGAAAPHQPIPWQPLRKVQRAVPPTHSWVQIATSPIGGILWNFEVYQDEFYIAAKDTLYTYTPDTDTWTMKWDGHIPDNLRCLAQYNSKLYMGGSQNYSKIYDWNGSTATNVYTITPTMEGYNLLMIVPCDGDLYIGPQSWISTPEEDRTHVLYKYDGVDWTVSIASDDNEANISLIRGVALLQGVVYVGARSLTGSPFAGVIAKFTGGSWSRTYTFSTTGDHHYPQILFTFQNKVYFGIQNNTTLLYSSEDGTTWTAEHENSDAYACVSYGVYRNQLFVGLYGKNSNGGNYIIRKSGNQWIPYSIGTQVIYAFTVFEGKFYAGAADGTIWQYV